MVEDKIKENEMQKIVGTLAVQLVARTTNQFLTGEAMDEKETGALINNTVKSLTELIEQEKKEAVKRYIKLLSEIVYKALDEYLKKGKNEKNKRNI